MTRRHLEEQESNMPKQTFFHLSIDKQDILIKAAKKEFSRVPLHEASIANIIKSAGIPRGSFYQYFKDKEDLFFFLLKKIGIKNNERFKEKLREKKGDLFASFIEIFQDMIKNHRSEEHKNFFKNAFLNMNYKLENSLADNVHEEDKKNQYLDTLELIDTTKLNIRDKEELHHIIKIITAVTFQNLVQSFVKDLSNEETLKNYKKQMELLQRGFQKDDVK